MEHLTIKFPDQRHITSRCKKKATREKSSNLREDEREINLSNVKKKKRLFLFTFKINFRIKPTWGRATGTAANESRLIFHRRSKRAVQINTVIVHLCPDFAMCRKRLFMGRGMRGRAFIANIRIIPRERSENF